MEEGYKRRISVNHDDQDTHVAYITDYIPKYRGQKEWVLAYDGDHRETMLCQVIGFLPALKCR